MNERYPKNNMDKTDLVKTNLDKTNLGNQIASFSAARFPEASPQRDKPRTSMAVALHYSGRGAPRVTAKGDGLIAQKIIDTARQHGVPLEEDAALVGALSRVDIGREIPRELWIAVAHVLTFAWSVAGKKKP